MATFPSIRDPYTRASDCWAFGVLVLETLRGGNPLCQLEAPLLLAKYREWAARTDQPVLALDIEPATVATATPAAATVPERPPLRQ